MLRLPLSNGRICRSFLFSTAVGIVAQYSYADNMRTRQQPFSVKIGASRIIYGLASGGATLSVSNPQDYPILVQSVVLGEDTKSKAPFVVTPPLFRLEGQQQSRLRIVRTGGDFANDRESLQWLCVNGIPPKADEAWAKGGARRIRKNRTLSFPLATRYPETAPGDALKVQDQIDLFFLVNIGPLQGPVGAKL
ncbi:MAG: fimbria/pilus periplasmic chaperone [Pseudomonas sp.]|uniref:fimbria/pilus periplasmic chaperone n=1 Tax=Pseudomonas sp. TaxID=306 RepID=UPI002FCB5A59